jgi:hypothetical protein
VNTTVSGYFAVHLAHQHGGVFIGVVTLYPLGFALGGVFCALLGVAHDEVRLSRRAHKIVQEAGDILVSGVAQNGFPAIL